MACAVFKIKNYGLLEMLLGCNVSNQKITWNFFSLKTTEMIFWACTKYKRIFKIFQGHDLTMCVKAH